MIDEIKNRGAPVSSFFCHCDACLILYCFQNGAGQPCITFGQLFEETANIFDALVGILKTAKKYAVLWYEGDQVMLQ